MTDSTTTYVEGLWLPSEIWITIASFLDYEDLAIFRQLCKITQSITILQSLYNRLYHMDSTLPALLPQEDAAVAFKQAFEKIQSRQQFEIAYLTEQHPLLMAKPEYMQVLQENTTASLKSLEAVNAILDKINSEIITAQINVNRPSLYLDKTHITRLPVALFQAEGYVHFWQNLTNLYCRYNQLTTLNVQGLKMLEELYCSNNQLTTLDVQGLVALRLLHIDCNKLTSINMQGLTALKELWCEYNQLTALNVQGLLALQWLVCSYNPLTELNMHGLAVLWCLSCGHNKLTILNVQGLAALKRLECEDNPLKTLILTGVHMNTKNKYAELEKTLLFNELSQVESPENRQAIILRLGADNYTHENCLKYCPDYAATLFAFDFANTLASSALSQASAFLPFFGENNLKRKRNEEEVCIESPSEESDNQTDLKKRKRK